MARKLFSTLVIVGIAIAALLPIVTATPDRVILKVSLFADSYYASEDVPLYAEITTDQLKTGLKLRIYVWEESETEFPTDYELVQENIATTYQAAHTYKYEKTLFWNTGMRNASTYRLIFEVVSSNNVHLAWHYDMKKCVIGIRATELADFVVRTNETVYTNNTYFKLDESSKLTNKGNMPVSGSANISCELQKYDNITGTWSKVGEALSMSGQKLGNFGNHGDLQPGESINLTEVWNGSESTTGLEGDCRVYFELESWGKYFYNSDGTIMCSGIEPRLVINKRVEPPTVGIGNTKVKVVLEVQCVGKSMRDSGVFSIGVGRPPVDVVLVFDESGSMAWDTSPTDTTDRIIRAQEAARAFVDMLGYSDRIGFVSFNSYYGTPYSIQTPPDDGVKTWSLAGQYFTSSKSAIIQAINSTEPGGSTPLWDGAGEAMCLLVTHGDPTHIWIVILFTDGCENDSDKWHTDPWDISYYGYKNVTTYANNNSITIYSIGFGDDVDDDALTAVANLTGGQYYFAPSAEELQEAFAEIGARLFAAITNVTIHDTFNITKTELDATSFTLDGTDIHSYVTTNQASGTIEFNYTKISELKYLSPGDRYEISYKMTVKNVTEGEKRTIASAGSFDYTLLIGAYATLQHGTFGSTVLKQDYSVGDYLIVLYKKALIDKFGENNATLIINETKKLADYHTVNGLRVTMLYIDTWVEAAAASGAVNTSNRGNFSVWLDDNIINKVLRDLGARYMLIVGGDNIIPFARISNAFINSVDNRDTEDGYPKYVSAGNFLSDFTYADVDDDWLPDTNDAKVGRLVGDTDIIIKTINRSMQAPTSDKAYLVGWNMCNEYGYWWQDNGGNWHRRNSTKHFEQNVRGDLAGAGYTVNVTLETREPWPWDADQNNEAQFNIQQASVVANLSAYEYGIIEIHGHSDADATTMSDHSDSDNSAPEPYSDIITAADLANTNLSGHPLVVSQGCHGGVVLDNHVSGANLPLTWLDLNATAFIGSTGLTWHYYNTYGGSDRVIGNFFHYLAGGNDIGTALVRAKHDANMSDVKDEKTVYEYVLYGDPAYDVYAVHSKRAGNAPAQTPARAADSVTNGTYEYTFTYDCVNYPEDVNFSYVEVFESWNRVDTQICTGNGAPIIPMVKKTINLAPGLEPNVVLDDITLTTTFSNLSLLLDFCASGTSSSSVYLQPPSGTFPSKFYDWYADDLEDGSKNVELFIYPLQWWSGNQTGLFYGEFTFNLTSTAEPVSLMDVNVTFYVDKPSVAPGGLVKASVLVSNRGSMDAYNLTVTITADGFSTGDPAVNAPDATVVGSQITWNVGSLPKVGMESFRVFTVNLTAGTAGSKSITFSVTYEDSSGTPYEEEQLQPVTIQEFGVEGKAEEKVPLPLWIPIVGIVVIVVVIAIALGAKVVRKRKPLE